MRKTLYLIDGHYQIYRAHFAPMGGRMLTTAGGAPVQAVYVLVTILSKLRRDRAPEYWAIAMDSPGPTQRHEIYPEYKATRPEMPQELVAQLDWIEESLAGLRIPVLRAPGWEADDIIATLATRAERDGFDVRILSRDKDLEQVLSPQVKFLDLSAGTEIGPEELHRKKGIVPARVVEYQALVGDASDNIPGVPGIGPKTAVKILDSVADIDRLLDDAAHPGIPAATLAKIRAHAGDLRLSRRLATLDRNVPLEPGVSRFAVVEPDRERLRALYRTLGFQRLLEEIEPEREPAEAPFREQPRYSCVRDEAKLSAVLAACRAAGRFAFDTETSGLDSTSDRAVGFSLAIAAGEAYYVPLERPGGALPLPRERTLELLAPLLADPAIGKIGHHIKFDSLFMAREGIAIRGIELDTMLAAYLLNPSRSSYKLDTLVGELLGKSSIPIGDLLGAGAAERSMADLEPEAITDYAAQDADYTLQLADRLRGEIHAQGLGDVLALELSLIEVLVDMEREGITLDAVRLAELEVEVAAAAARIEHEIYRACGGEFNIRSPKQLQEVLFSRLGLPPRRRTKSGLSTSADVLEEIAAEHPEHPVPALVLEYRSLMKLLGSYIQTLPRLVRRATGRLHTEFRQHVAATGRLSSNEPNLQNIPVKSELGRRIRLAFIPNRSGDVFLSADYSQIELRLLAHLSGDEALIAALNAGADIHRQVAAVIHGKPSGEVSREERQAAKAVTFGVIYGMGPFGLARELRIPIAAATEFIEAFFAGFPGVRSFIERSVREARERGEVRTLLGRRRPVPEIVSRVARVRNQGERVAVNSIVQGSAADLIKKAMVSVHGRLRRTEPEARILLQIHDELLLEVPKVRVAALAALVRETMEGVFALRVPLLVNVATGENWYDASK